MLICVALIVRFCVFAIIALPANPIAPPVALLLVSVTAEPAKSSGLVKLLSPMVLPETVMPPPAVTSSPAESVCAFTVPTVDDAESETFPVPLVVSIRPTVTSPPEALTVTLPGAVRLLTTTFDPTPEVPIEMELPVELIVLTVMPPPELLRETEPAATMLLTAIALATPDVLTFSDPLPASMVPSVTAPELDEKVVGLAKLAAVFCRV